MFKIPNSIPTRSASAEEWADYMEYMALKNRNKSGISFLDQFRPAKVVSDEILVDGIEDENERYYYKLDDIASELRRRITFGGDRYPFELINKDYGLRFISKNNTHHLIYRYLLLATRHNMKKSRVHDGIDGALLFEELCGVVAENYFGHPVNVRIFGTSNTSEGSFRARLQNVLDEIKEGGKIHTHNGYKPKDDKIDIILWKSFKDFKSSQLIAYAQCKTGTSWQDDLTSLNPVSFNSRWLPVQMVNMPLKIFFCTMYFPQETWQARAYDAGLIFDRFRILEFLPKSIEVALRTKIFRWTTAAESFEKLQTIKELKKTA